MSKTFKTMPQLLEENKRLLQDKKRLDWLEKRGVWDAPSDTKVWRVKIIGNPGHEVTLRESIRAAIDAAMEAAK